MNSSDRLDGFKSVKKHNVSVKPEVQNKSLEVAQKGVVKVKEVVVCDIEAIRTCERKEIKENNLDHSAQGLYWGRSSPGGKYKPVYH